MRSDPSAADDSHAGQAFFSSLPGPTRFILARHGQSEGNARRIIQGRLDLPLDETGRAQARSLGRWLAGEKPDALFSSPLARAAETADILARACGLSDPVLTPLLAELDTGIFTGLSLEETAERHPAAAHAFGCLSWDGVPGAESSVALYGRAMHAWRLLRDRAMEPRARTIVALSHGGFLQWLVRSTFGCRTWMPLYATGNCGVFELFAETPGPGDPAYLIWRRIDWRSPDELARIEQVF